MINKNLYLFNQLNITLFIGGLSMEISFTSYGAAECVLGSKHLLQVDNYRMLLDVGLEYGDKIKPFAFDPKTIDSLFLSHGHVDHIGRVFDLVDAGFSGKIYCHPATKDFLGMQLNGEINTYAKNKKNNKQPKIQIAKTMDDIINRTISVHYGENIKLTDYLHRTSIDAGHIVGSEQEIFTVLGDRQIKIGFSGDLGRRDNATAIVKHPNELPKNLDFYILEGTYGAKRHNKSNIVDELSDWIEKAYLGGGKIIFPSFTLQRAQNLLAHLFEVYQQKRIPKEMKIFVDSPSIVKVNNFMLRHTYCFDPKARQQFSNKNHNPFKFPGLYYTRDHAESQNLLNNNQSAIIVTSSGMCNGGRIENYLDDALKDSRNYLVLISYQAKGTIGEKLINNEKQIIHAKKIVDVNATIGNIHGFSSHSDCNETITHLKNCKNPAKGEDFSGIFLVHGEKQSLIDLKQELNNVGYQNVVIAEPEKKYDLMGMLK